MAHLRYGRSRLKDGLRSYLPFGITREQGVSHIDPIQTFHPKDGYVPGAGTAIKIAEAVWLPIYGKQIENEKPFKAHLKDDMIWVVEGTLPPHMLGGVAYAEIQKADGKILSVIHGK